MKNLKVFSLAPKLDPFRIQFRVIFIDRRKLNLFKIVCYNTLDINSKFPTLISDHRSINTSSSSFKLPIPRDIHRQILIFHTNSHSLQKKNQISLFSISRFEKDLLNRAEEAEKEQHALASLHPSLGIMGKQTSSGAASIKTEDEWQQPRDGIFNNRVRETREGMYAIGDNRCCESDLNMRRGREARV